MPKSSPSLRDVAQAAGVSLGTASRALNNKSNVLPATRSMVLKAAADLGYKLQIRVPTTVASKLRTIGVVVKRDPVEYPRLDPFNYAVLCGVEAECERLGLGLMYASLPVDAYSHASTWSSLLENSDVDGLVIIGIVISDPAVTSRIPQQIPVVVVDAAATGLDCDTIITHNVQGAYEAVNYLIEQGHTRIGIVGSDRTAREHPGITERRDGYLMALSDHGIEETYIEDSQLNGEAAYAATKRLLQRAPEVTAVFACNDEIAQYVVQAAQDEGLRVPDDISVIGFDDTVVALRTQPQLTTMRVAKELMGILAVHHVYERSMNLDRPPIKTLIGTRLTIRESVMKCSSRQSNRPDIRKQA